MYAGRPLFLMSIRSLLCLVGCLPTILRLPAIKLLHRRLSDDLTLSSAGFRDLRVLVIGPARTVCDDLKSLDTSRYDVIVKMNNGLDTPVLFPTGQSLACHVLFHSGTCEARPITEKKLRDANVKMLVHRAPTKSGFLQTLALNCRFGHFLKVRHIACLEYQKLSAQLSGASPTTGLLSTCFFLSAPVSEVAIVGFTFFATAYQKGYDDCVTSDEQAVCRIADKGHHKPAQEAVLLSHKIEDARTRGVTVTLGPNVLAAINCCIASERHRAAALQPDIPV
jgi:hypothetical protein